jgi:hypothetical protein
MKIVIAVFAFAVLTLTSRAAAQAQPSPACRAVAAVDDAMIGLTRGLFYGDTGHADSVYAQLRAHFGIRKLTPSEPVAAVRDVAVCEEWLPAVAAALRSDYDAAHTTDGYLFEMIQYGPYMLVLAHIDPATLPPGVSLAGNRIRRRVFEVSGKRYLGFTL